LDQENNEEETVTRANVISGGGTKLARDIRHIPAVIFYGSHDDKPKSALREYIDETPNNVLDGVVKGVLSVSNGVFQGVTGLVTEPIRHAKEEGTVGFFKGIGKGLTGVVLKPVAGVVDLGSKAAQGIMNTPQSIHGAFKGHSGQTNHKQEDFEVEKDAPGLMFGLPVEISLSNAIKLGVPHVVDQATNYLKSYVHEEGLFRLSGSVNQINHLKNLYDSGDVVHLTHDNPNYGPHEIACLLKLFFRSLPEPLFTFKRYRVYLEVQADANTTDEEKLQVYKAFIKALPEGNRNVLQTLLDLLYLVASNSDKNLMKTSNLATIFGPCLLSNPVDVAPRDPKPSKKGLAMEAMRGAQEMYLEVGLSINILTLMMNNYHFLFEY